MQLVKLVSCLTFTLLATCVNPSRDTRDVSAAEAEQEVQRDHQFDTVVLKPQIWGGTATPTGTFRFVATLGISPSLGYFTGTCGGVLIDAGWVLTAAHCAGNDTIILGRRRPSAPGGEVHSFARSDAFCHKDFNASTLENDVALIRLPQGSGISPVPMASNSNWETSTPPPTVLLAGWGAGTSSPDLQNVRVKLLTDRVQCAQFFRTGGIALDNQSFCTFSPSGGALDDDSGGPVLLPQTSGMLLVGIMSAGDVAGGPNKHSRVASYHAWITNVMSGGRTMTKTC